MRWLDRFWSDEEGSLTIEFVLWIPVIVALVVIVVDATTLYITHSEMWNVARDTARQMSTGVIATEADAEACAANGMRLRSDYPYYVDANYDDAAGSMTVLIALRVNDMSIMGASVLFKPLTILGGDMTARVVMREDPQGTFGDGASSADCMTVADGSGGGPGNSGGGPGNPDNKGPKK